MIWAIELAGYPRCWIRRPNDAAFPGSSTETHITFQWKEAHKFPCREDANHEMLRLSLPRNWKAVGIVRGEKTR